MTGRLIGTQRRGSHPQTVVVLGDSLTEQGGMLPNGTSPNIKPTSYWTWANVLLGQRFRVLRNAGVFGQTSAQILARLEQDVISLNPGWCWLLVGTNDVGKGYLEATTKPNIRRILDRLEQAGIRVAWLTIPPRIGTSYTGTTEVDTVKLNEWIRTEARGRSNVVLCDIWPALAAPFNYQATVYGHNPTPDGIHLSDTGGFAAGQIVANALSSLTQATDAFHSPTQPYGLNQLPDPRFANGGSGSAPTNWTVTNFPAGTTWSKTARTDMPWSWQTVTIPAASTAVCQLQGNGGSDSSGRAAPQMVGQRLVATIEFQASGLDQAAADGSQALYLSCAFYNGATFTHNYAMQSTSAPNAARSGRLLTHPVTVPAGTTTISLFVFIVGGGTYNFDRAGIYNVSQSGLLLP